MDRQQLVFDGYEKQIYSTADPDTVILHFKDDITAYDNIRRAKLTGKGAVNCGISALLFAHLGGKHIATHFIEKISADELLCRKVTPIPIELVVHNYIAGSLADKLDLPEGMKPSTVIYDLRYNSSELGDPLINDSQAVALGIASFSELGEMYDTARKINSCLVKLFDAAGLKFVDMKLQFGKTSDGALIVSDEISPDTCRIWDADTDEKLDKDRFRHDLGNIVDAYGSVYQKLKNILG
ncbi:MAG: phosphoribosylaminoimidazolesuccinocarboxamide synthase [Bacteroidales bacterium]|nr:phosphoribosylaminoimidazolesuccinocarboxamide synthase [Bacteroidales bacterium]